MEVNNEKCIPLSLMLLAGIIPGTFLLKVGSLVAYISRTTDNKSEFRANICCVFLVDNIFRFFYTCLLGY